MSGVSVKLSRYQDKYAGGGLRTRVMDERTYHKSRGLRGQEGPGPEPLYEVLIFHVQKMTINKCRTVPKRGKTTKKRHKVTRNT